MGSERGDEYKRPCSLGEGTGSKEPDYSEAPQWATASRLVPTHQQDHRAIKRRCAAMAGGFKSFGSAAITLAGIELAHRIRKRQFSFGRGRYQNFGSLKKIWDRGPERGAVCKGDSIESLLTDKSITNILKSWSGLESSIETKRWTALRALSGRKATPRLLPRTCSLP